MLSNFYSKKVSMLMKRTMTAQLLFGLLLKYSLFFCCCCNIISFLLVNSVVFVHRQDSWMLSNFWPRKEQKLTLRTIFSAQLLFLRHRTYEFIYLFWLVVFFKLFLLLCDVQEGQWDIVKFLVEKGAKVDQTDDEGKTPLSLAAHVCILIWF